MFKSPVINAVLAFLAGACASALLHDVLRGAA